MSCSTKATGTGFFRFASIVLVSGMGWLSALLFAAPAWGQATPLPTPTFVPRVCALVGASSVELQARLIDVSLPLSGTQVWRFGPLDPDSTRQIVHLPSESHFNCTSTTFSGENVKICARVDQTTYCHGGPNDGLACPPADCGAGNPCDVNPGHGVIDCAGGNLAGYNSLVQIDHNTNQNNVGLPQDPNCTNTFTAPDGTVLHSCLEGTDPACTGPSHPHTGVCNSPVEQTFSGSSPAGGFRLHEAIDLSFTFGEDCRTPCPPDNTPLQDGELQLAGDLTSGEAKGVIWNANNTALIMGTTGSGNCPVICGIDPCCPPFAGTPIGNCLTDVTLDGAQAVLEFPAIDLDPTIGDFIARLKLQCVGGPLPTPTQTPGADDCCQCLVPAVSCSEPLGGSCGPHCSPVYRAVCTGNGDCEAYTPTSTTTPTPTMTPTPTLTPALACAAAPRAGCQSPQRAAGISLNAAAHTVGWKWLGGATPVALSQFGDPVSGSAAYHLCVYDTSAGPPSLTFGATVPAGGTCGGQPCWKQTRKRFSYRNSAATPDGVRQLTLQATGNTGASIVVSGRGPNLHTPVSADGVFLLREFPQVIVQLQRSDSPNCWEAVFTSPPSRDTRWAFVDTIH
jgi:hypothetical protein